MGQGWSVPGGEAGARLLVVRGDLPALRSYYAGDEIVSVAPDGVFILLRGCSKERLSCGSSINWPFSGSFFGLRPARCRDLLPLGSLENSARASYARSGCGL